MFLAKKCYYALVFISSIKLVVVYVATNFWRNVLPEQRLSKTWPGLGSLLVGTSSSHHQSIIAYYILCLNRTVSQIELSIHVITKWLIVYDNSACQAVTLAQVTILELSVIISSQSGVNRKASTHKVAGNWLHLRTLYNHCYHFHLPNQLRKLQCPLRHHAVVVTELGKGVR